MVASPFLDLRGVRNTEKSRRQLRLLESYGDPNPPYTL
jgi:hypothetical protein